MPVLVVVPLLVAVPLLWSPHADAAPTPHDGPSATNRLAAVRAVVETPALYDDTAGGDADADDPAIWVHPTDRSGSLVIATAKNGGLRVYDLHGRERQVIPTPAAPVPDDEPGRFNNVDLVRDFPLGGERVDLAVVTDRGRDQLRFYRIDPATRRLADVPCADPGDGPQVEGTVVDPTTGVAYLAQESVGLWRIPARGGRFQGVPQVVEHTREYGIPAAYDPGVDDCVVDDCVVDHAADPGFGGRIAADVEGLTIRQQGRYDGTLVVSSQGDDTFYTYDRRTLRPLGRFAVTAGSRVDGAQECDGADVVSTPLPGYPGGLLVVHEGANTPDVTGGDGVRPNTNFKFLDAGFLRQR